MPKQRITKEMVVEAAFEIAREYGVDKVLVKNIAEKIGCSVQPIYSYCSNMEGLKTDLYERTRAFFREYVAAHLEKDNFFQSTGKSYLYLVKEEPHLYEFYFLKKSPNRICSSLEELYQQECSLSVAEHLAQELSISLESAKKLHLHMIIYNSGIASIQIASGFGLDMKELEQQLQMAYEAFWVKIRKEEENE